MFIKLVLTIFLGLTCLSCTRVYPVNPENTELRLENVEQMSFDEQVRIQKEIIKRQERQLIVQKEELEQLRRQQIYNQLK